MRHTPVLDRSIYPDVFAGTQDLYRFDNGYGASVVDNPWIFRPGLELAVIKWSGANFELTYDTPVTNDVINGLTKDQVDDLLDDIEKLEKPNDSDKG